MKKTILFAVATIALFSVVAFAGPAPSPVVPPSWWGLDDGNTRSSMEDFDDDSLPGEYDYHVGIGGAAADTWSSEGFEWGDEGGFDFLEIDNSEGNEGINGYILIDIANIANPNNSKEVFFEAWYWGEGEYSLSFSLYTDDVNCSVYNLGSGGGFIPGTDESYFYGNREIVPQPAQEYLRLDVFVAAGSEFQLDALYFGTHCEAIPEPSTIAIMLTGASGLFVAARRKFRK